MGIHIPQLLDAILEATAAEQGAKARIAGLRAALEDEARRRYATEGAAPTWKAPKLGTVRYDAPGEWTAAVADEAVFSSWVAEHHPTEATAVLRIPAASLPGVLEALAFAGVAAETRVEVRPAWSGPFLSSLTVDVEEVATDDDTMTPTRGFTVADPVAGELVPGTTGHRTAGRLVVSLDRDRRTAAIEAAQNEGAELVAAATTDDSEAVDLTGLDERRRELEGMHADVLKAYAGRLDLGGSGTKPELAERIARAEALTGCRELLTASHLTTDPVVAKHVDDAIATAAELEAEHRARIGADYGRELAGPELAKAVASNLKAGLLAAAYDDTDPDVIAAVAAIELEANRGKHAEALAADAIEAAGNRETLRTVAKARGLSPAGTKTELALRLAQDGATPAAVAAAITI